MGKLEFDEDRHIYTMDGERIPGVTEILAMADPEGYRNINPAVLEHAAMKGTLVHEWCEMYDYCGENEEPVPSELEPYCQAYADFVRDYRPEWTGIEQMVFCDTAPTGIGYAGIADRIGRIHGKNCVVDIKTIASPGTKTHIKVCCQTAAYSAAAGIWGKRYALYLKPDGTYKLMDCRDYEQKHGFDGYILFSKMYALYTEINEIGGKKNGK